MRSSEIVLGFHSLCLVKPVEDDDWYMGSLYDDGSIGCWTAYGALYEALRGLQQIEPPLRAAGLLRARA
ncbi:hypothetical protein [Streptomyces sp. NPDC088357]|uniref:hypothetical protein n=1 Tax=Streptomyces sp. NPDC088357 TaxID=3154655 RepID=UPI00342B1F6D